MNVLKDYPKARKVIYLVYAVVGVAIGALTIGYATGATVPEWLDVTTRVFAYLGVALGFTASANVPPADE